MKKNKNLMGVGIAIGVAVGAGLGSAIDNVGFSSNFKTILGVGEKTHAK